MSERLIHLYLTEINVLFLVHISVFISIKNNAVYEDLIIVTWVIF